jgi:hypothetical protein
MFHKLAAIGKKGVTVIAGACLKEKSPPYPFDINYFRAVTRTAVIAGDAEVFQGWLIERWSCSPTIGRPFIAGLLVASRSPAIAP